MAPPDVSSFPWVVRFNKPPAIYSPLPHSLSYKRNQFKIALSWWARKKDKITGLKGQIKRLTDNISTLEEEVRISTDYISQLEA